MQVLCIGVDKEESWYDSVDKEDSAWRTVTEDDLMFQKLYEWLCF